MIKAFVIFFIVTGVIILFFTKKIILIKKSIFYKYIDKTKKLSNVDYLMDYDGNWLFKKINYEKLYEETNDDSLLDAKRRIRIYEIIYISLFITLMLLGIFFKVFAII